MSFLNQVQIPILIKTEYRKKLLLSQMCVCIPVCICIRTLSKKEKFHVKSKKDTLESVLHYKSGHRNEKPVYSSKQ